MRRGARGVGNALERVLWASRLVMVVPVVCSILMSFAALYLATVDTLSVLGRLAAYSAPDLAAAARSEMNKKIVTTLIKAVDLYLLAAILLIFGLGLYELFIGKITPAEDAEIAPRLLLIRSLDDLKDRLAKVVLLLLVVEFLQQALLVTYHSPLDLLYLGVGILFIGGALYLTGQHPPGRG